MEDPDQAAWIIMYASVGAAYLLYGFKRSKRVAIGAGAGFIIVPHLLTVPWALLTLGAVFLLLPMIWRQ